MHIRISYKVHLNAGSEILFLSNLHSESEADPAGLRTHLSSRALNDQNISLLSFTNSSG